MSKKLNILISYAYWNKNHVSLLEKYRDHLNVLVDSGAFTAYTQGREITLKEYHDFLSAHSELIDEYIQLDVVGDSGKTIVNLEKSREAGFNPLPVFTRGHTVEYLHEIGDERFCVGGLDNQDKDSVLEFILENAPGAKKAHLLGVDKLHYFKHQNPPQSIDASTWLSGLRFGVIPVTGAGGSMMKLDFNMMKNPKTRAYAQVERVLRTLGVNIRELRDRSQWRNTKGSLLQKVTALTGIHRAHVAKELFDGDVHLVLAGGHDHQVLTQSLESEFFERKFK